MVKLLKGNVTSENHRSLVPQASNDCPLSDQAWQGDSGKQLAAFSTSPPSCSLATHSINNKPFLAVSRFFKKILIFINLLSNNYLNMLIHKIMN